MKLIRYPADKKIESVITIGNFDGLHLGHQRLINALVDSARALNLSSILFTFEPHPSELFTPDKPAARLMRFSEKWNSIKKLRIDYLYCARFSRRFAALSAEEFVQKILVEKLGAKKIIIGDNFRFGAKRLGDVTLLKELGKKLGFEVEALSQSLQDGERISSTRVRDALQGGDFKTARALTRHPFMMSGKVAHGDQVGRTLGFPTANIYLHRKRVPLMGVFAVRVHGLNNVVYPAVASLGYRPTFNGQHILLEVFIFDFDQNIYGKHISVELIEKIRDEENFEKVEDLVSQMEQDVIIAKEIQRNHTLSWNSL